MAAVQSPVNLKDWIEENREKFKPPVSNRYLYDGRDFFVMVIKGPNARNDFHLVDSEEYFTNSRVTSKCAFAGDRTVDHIVREARRSLSRRMSPPPRRPPDTLGVVVSVAAAREKGMSSFTVRIAGVGGRHSLRLRGHRRAFQPGDARFLERRRAACLQEVWQKSREAGTC
jgi:3-hydroxyanthranilate 3,4-dioxygenase